MVAGRMSLLGVLLVCVIVLGAGCARETDRSFASPGVENTPPIEPTAADAAVAPARALSDAGFSVAGSSAPAPHKEGTCLAGSGDYLDMGPYPTTMADIDLGGTLGKFTLFYPTELDESCPHPIVAWGNGATSSGSAAYAHYNSHAASWGIVVIASHSPFVAGGDFSGAIQEGAIDYLLAQNEDSASKFHGKLSTRAGLAGHSNGALGATQARHPNVQAVVSVAGGGEPDPKVAFICETGVGDFIRAPCTSSYEAATGPAFLADHQEGNHVVTQSIVGATTPAGVQYVRAYTAWMRCFLGDDGGACALFEGGVQAPLCGDSNWAVCDGKNL